ncbi:MAG: MaoC family dehydratase N-terminal domain-containing protein [Bacillota bacterium]
MISKDIIGRESNPVRIKIESHMVRRFAEAAGIPFSNQVPPTFVGTFGEGGIDGVDLLQYETIHVEQKITYYQPVSIGDCITYTRRITDVYERVGRLGKMIFIVIETKGRNPAGEPVFSCSSTMLVLGRRAEDETPLGLSG